MFGAAVAAQFLTAGWSVTRDLQAGMGAMLIGIGLAVLAVWLPSPSLALFIAGGVVIGAGSGAIFKGAVGTVMSISPPDRIAESLTGVFLAAYVGISLPVVGAGISLARHVTPKVTILGFAIAVTVGIAAAAIKLLTPATTPATVGPTPATGHRARREPRPRPDPAESPAVGNQHTTRQTRDTMSDNPNQITIDNSVLILVDVQHWVAFSVKSIDAGLLSNNLAGLAASAKALNVPIVLTTVGAVRGALEGPPMKALADVITDVNPIDRVSTNAWPDVRETVEATGRRTLLIAGLWTEVCLAQTVVSAMADG